GRRGHHHVDRRDAGRRSGRDRRPVSAPGTAAPGRDGGTVSVRDVLSQGRRHPVSERVRDAGESGGRDHGRGGNRRGVRAPSAIGASATISFTTEAQRAQRTAKENSK